MDLAKVEAIGGQGEVAMAGRGLKRDKRVAGAVQLRAAAGFVDWSLLALGTPTNVPRGAFCPQPLEEVAEDLVTGRTDTNVVEYVIVCVSGMRG